MSKQFRWTAMRQLFLALWAVGTLILLFVVILLVREIAANGRDPIGAFQLTAEEAAAIAPAPRTTSLDARELLLYFSTRNGQSLTAEKRMLPFDESTVENCKTVINALVEGPRTELSPVLPAEVKVKSVFLLSNGELVINFSRELQSLHARFTSASLESLLVQGVVQTVTQTALQGGQDPRITRVRFLIENEPPTEAFPAHINLAEPVAPDAQWLAAQT